MDYTQKIAIVVVIVVVVGVIITYNTLGAQKESSNSPFESVEPLPNEPDTTQPIYVDIKGKVRKPGVYKLQSETRLFALIDKAGGLSQNGCTNQLNLARKLQDGEMIVVGSISQQESHDDAQSDMPDNGLININTADEATLTTLPNIGPASAKAIIEYRETHGAFDSVEALTDVSGIGTTTLESIRELIKI